MPSQYSFPCPDCGADSSSSEYFFKLYAGRTVTRWCEKCKRLFDVEVPQAKTAPPPEGQH